MKTVIFLLLLSIAVAIGAGMVGRERHRAAIEKRLIAVVESSGIVGDESGGIEVRFDHFTGSVTGTVTGTVGSEEEKRTLLARLSEVVGADRLEDRLVVSAPEAVVGTPGAPVSPAEPLPSAAFRLEKADDLLLVLAGVVPSGEVKSGFFNAARRVAPELVTVEDRMRVDAAVVGPDWIAGTPDLIGRLVGGVQDPLLAIDGETATIGGASDDRDALKSLGAEFRSLFADFAEQEDRLLHDKSRPAPATRLPLVMYMGPWEGKVLLEGSLPTGPQVKGIESAAVSSRGSDKVVSRLRVSPQTVAEPWLAGLPSLVTALLEAGGENAELIIVDRSLTVSGTFPDKTKMEALAPLLEPISAAGYRVVVELTVKP